MLKLLTGRRYARVLALSLALCLVIGVILPFTPAAAIEELTPAGDPAQITAEPSPSSETNISPDENLVDEGTASATDPDQGDTELPPASDAVSSSDPDNLEPPALEGAQETGAESVLSPSESSPPLLLNSQPYYPPHLQVESQMGLVNSEVAIEVNLFDPGLAAGYSFALNYDPQMIAPVVDALGVPRVEAGALGGSPEANIISSGQLLIAAAGTESASTNPVRLCTLYFKLLKEGVSSLEPAEAEIYDEMAQPISGVTLAPGTIEAAYPDLSIPVAVPDSGIYNSVQRVSLKTANAEEYIYYTLDESDPADPANPARQLYSGPILVNQSLIIIAVTYREGRYGEPDFFDYMINLAGISGNITYRGEPLAGIPVKVKKDGVVLNTVSTNTSGSYIFPALQDGQYVVAAGGADGFNLVESEPITLDSSKRQAQQDFQLFRGNTIKGLVQVPEGYSPADIEVYADSSGSYAMAWTEADGSFWLDGLKPASDNAVCTVFTRNYLGLNDAQVEVNLSAANMFTDISGNPLILTAPEQASLTGVVSQVDNQPQSTPLAGMWISVYSPSTYSWGDAETDEKGRYFMENLTPADDYLISYYHWQDNLSGTLEGSTTIATGANTKNINIPVGLQITGTVTSNKAGENTPVAGLNVWASGPKWGSAVTDEQGNYTISYLSAGTYTVEIDMWNSLEVVDDRSQEQKTVTVGPENPSVTHDIRLIPAGTISGQVQTHPEGGQEAVRITAYSSTTDVYRTATTNKSGGYVLRGISPADDYVVTAWKWPYEEAEQINVAADQANVDFTLNHPDLQKGYFKPQNNRYLAMNPSIAPEKVVGFKLDYQNCNPSQAAAGAKAEFTLPAGLELSAGSLTLNGAGVVEPYNTRVEGSTTVLVVNLGDVAVEQKGTVIFQAQHNPLASHAINLSSQARIVWADKNEIIGTAQVEIVQVDINGPPFTKPGKFTVYGKCADSALVKVMGKKTGSADLLLGQARAEGKWWTASVEINTAGTYQLYAIAEKGGAASAPSSPITVEIKADTAVLEDVTINAGWNQNVKSNPKIGIPAIAVSQGYTVEVDAVFSSAVDTSAGQPQLLFALKDETINLKDATPADFQVTGQMSSLEAAGEQKTWKGSFYVDYTLSGDLKAYIYYYTGGSWHLVPVVQIAILIDPSGIITDFHTGQPIEGVRAECEYKVDGSWQRWPAENFGQVNPQLTDVTGHYGWDVPTGEYRVRFTHAGYNDTISEVVYVPPPKTDLNLGLISLTASQIPDLKTRTPAAADVDIELNSTIMIEFTKDMDSDTVTINSFIVKDGSGTAVSGSISHSGRIFTFTPDSLAGKTTYTVQLTADIKDAFGKALEPTEWSFTTMAADSIIVTVAPQLSAYALSTESLTINITFSGKVSDATLPETLPLQIAAQTSPETTLATINAEVGPDGSFNVTWPVPTSWAEGNYTVKVFYDGRHWGSSLFQLVAVQTPIADKEDGYSFNTEPIQVILTSTGAAIYYTLDGNVPDTTKPAQLYTGPITIDHSCVLKAIAVKNGVASELASFSYTRTDECFIATASFGSKFVPAVVLLRQFRDRCLLTNNFGQAFVEFYYRNSPPIAHYIAERPALKVLVRGLLTPAVGAAYLALHPQTAALSLSIIFLLLLLTCFYRQRRLN